MLDIMSKLDTKSYLGIAHFLSSIYVDGNLTVTLFFVFFTPGIEIIQFRKLNLTKYLRGKLCTFLVQKIFFVQKKCGCGPCQGP